MNPAPPSCPSLSGGMLQCMAVGAETLDPDARAAVVRFVRDCQRPGGGFRGRHPKPDLYYTAFAIELLSALTDAEPPHATQAFVRSFSPRRLDLAHLACLARCVSRLHMETHPLHGSGVEGLGRVLRAFRAADGGYDLAAGSDRGTAYGGFLALLALEDLGMPWPGSTVSVALEHHLAPENLELLTTPNLAAAALVLQRSGRELPDGLSEWVLSRQHPLGGFVAGGQTPMPDLLSTAVALFALAIAAPERGCCITVARHREFVDLLWQEDGGFSGQAADTVSDCEYTYYALLALGCLG